MNIAQVSSWRSKRWRALATGAAHVCSSRHIWQRYLQRSAGRVLDVGLFGHHSGVFVLLKEQDSTGWAPAGTTTTVDAILTSFGYAPDTAVGVASGAEIGVDLLIGIQNVTGGSGNDVVVDSAGNNVIDLGAGNDSVWLRGGGVDTVKLGIGDDGLLVDNLLIKGDVLDGGAGYDRLDFVGGATYLVDLSSATIKGFETLGLSGVEAHISSKSLNSFELIQGYGSNIVLADRGAVIGKGSIMFNMLQMADGGQRLDFSQTTSQGDLILGGTGNDTIIGGYIVDAGLGNDLITGNEQGGSLSGGAGNDVLRAGAGATWLEGGAGRDTVIGSAGDDALMVNDPTHLVRGEIYDGGAGIDTLALTGPADLTQVAVRNIENITAYDSLRLSTAQLSSIQSVQATTLILADNGAVDFKGDFYVNTVVMAGGGQSLTLGGGNIIGGSGPDKILIQYGSVLGGAGDDRIALGFGGTADGGAGNDLLIAQGSGGVLTGGSGSDLFAFRPDAGTLPLNSSYSITDFARGLDRIDLSAIDADVTRASNTAFRFTGAHAFSGHAGELHLVQANGSTQLEGDTNGDGYADFSIGLNGVAVGAHDIVL